MARGAVIPSDEPAGLKAGRYVCLSVIDDGEGMDQLTLDHAWSRSLPRRNRAKVLDSVYLWCTVLQNNPGVLRVEKPERKRDHGGTVVAGW